MSDFVFDNLNWIFKQVPCFPTHGKNVHILETPDSFYHALLEGIQSAKHRILLTSLYLGVGQLEKCIVDELYSALAKAEESNRALDVNILLDYNRGCRDSKGSSKEMLMPLVRDFKNPLVTKKYSLQVSLYHSPQLRGAWKSVLPARWNEVIGLAHMKIYIFDDTVIVSGANLSHDYFTNRQDRYVKFENNKPLTDFFHSLVKAVSSFSFHLQQNGSLKFSDQCPYHPFEGDYDLFVSYVRSRLGPLIYPEFIHRDVEKTSKLSGFSSKTPISAMWCFYQKYFHSKDVYQHFRNVATQDKFKDMQHMDTYVFPSVQLGFAGINQDEHITKGILHSVKGTSQVCMTSGYFNITNDYANLIVNSPAKFNIYVASPEANGFLNASGLSGYIPAMYVHLTKNFYNRLMFAKRNELVKLWEYTRPGWTYHAKGMWVYNQQGSGPFLTMIGSPNFGSRSVERDMEAQVTIVTKNQDLMKNLHRERTRIADFSQPVTKDTFIQPRCKVPGWVALISTLIRKYF